MAMGGRKSNHLTSFCFFFSFSVHIPVIRVVFTFWCIKTKYWLPLRYYFFFLFLTLYTFWFRNTVVSISKLDICSSVAHGYSNFSDIHNSAFASNKFKIYLKRIIMVQKSKCIYQKLMVSTQIHTYTYIHRIWDMIHGVPAEDFRPKKVIISRTEQCTLYTLWAREFYKFAMQCCQ